MADINVFELTNKELHKSTGSKNSAKKSVSKKSVRESISKRSSKRRRPFNIPANKLRLESVSWFLKEEESSEENDATADYTPNDDVVLVIDPEMDEVPEDVDDAIEQAEELVGDHVCKCSICGANYVTDADITEEVEMEDETCPVCGETGEQIVVGVITPTEELSDEDAEEIEDTEEIDIEDEVEDEGSEGEEDIDFEGDFEEEEDEDFGESVKRSRARTLRRKAESVRRKTASKRRSALSRKTESARRRPIARRPMKRTAYKSVTESKAVSFDEVTFNRMLTRFAKENYSNVKFVNISKGTVRGKRLTLEGIVTTTKGSKRSIKFISENFKSGSKMTIRFRESGPFTESVRNASATFIVDCKMRGTTIVPTALRYSFKAKDASVRESKNIYSITGKVLSESVSRPAKVTRTRKNRRTR